MRKEIPPHHLSIELFPPVDPEKHRFLEGARDHPFVARPPAAPRHHPLNAWWLAELSLLAYNEPDEIASELEKADLKLAKRLKGRITQGFVAEGADCVIVALRGTEFFVPGRDQDLRMALQAIRGTILDSVTDVRFGLVEAPDPARGRVHAGFLAALDEIFDDLRDLPLGDRALWLTGHSLGGALAILAAARLPPGRVQGVYTFGAPSVGDARFAKAFPARSVRFVHGSDWVARLPAVAPLVPLRPPLLGRYRPEGEIVAFDRQGRLRKSVEPGGMATGLGNVRRRIKDIIRNVSDIDLLDHSPVFYTVHLWNFFDESLAS
jgi:triacylglycerol lipase